jgi:PAS domain S-box-containing protein
MKSPTLQRQLRFWTIFLVLVPSLLIMAIYSSYQIRSARLEKLDMISQRVYFQELLVQDWLDARAGDIRYFSKQMVFQSAESEPIKKRLLLMKQVNPFFDSLVYVDRQGTIVASTTDELERQSAVQQPYFQAALAGKEHITDVMAWRFTGTPLMIFSSPVFDDDGNFRGVVAGTVLLDTLEKILRNTWIGETGEVFIVNKDGVMLTEPRYASVLKERGLIKDTARLQFSITQDAFRNIRLDETGQATWTDYLDKKVLGAYRHIPERNWTVIGKIQEGEVLAPIYNQLALMVAGTLLVLLLIFPLTVPLTNRIRRPVDWLIRQSRLVAAGDYQAVSRAQCSSNMPRELNELCDTFIVMAATIERSVELLKDNEAKLQDLNTELAHQMAAVQEINATLEEEVAERQAAEESLRESRDAYAASEARYRGLFDHMHNGFNLRKVIVDADGRPVDLVYLEVNPGYERQYGMKAAEFVGRRLTEVFPDIAKEPFDWIQVLGNVALTGGPTSFEQYLTITGKWLRLDAYSPEKGYVASVVQDITENKRTEDQLRRYAEEVAATNREVQAFVNVVAHDFRSPMVNLKGFSSELGQSVLQLRKLIQQCFEHLPEKLRQQADEVITVDVPDALNFINTSVDRLSRMVDALLTLSRLGRREPVVKEIDMDELVSGVAKSFQHEIDRRQVSMNIAPLPKLMADQVMMEQIIGNLLDNAIKYLSPDRQGEIAVDYRKTNDEHLFTIEDNGRGIAPSDLEKIFEVFTRAGKRDVAGEGMGLAYVRTLVRQLGGRVWCESEPGVGTKLFFTVPVEREKLESAKLS